MGFETIFKKKKPSSERENAGAGRASDDIGKAAADAVVWANKGNELVENGRYAEAIQCYDKALEINPKLADIWNNKGLAHARTGVYAVAIQCYDKAIELKPDDEEVMYNKGIALAQLGRLPEAIACYDRLLEKNPNDAAAWCSKGDVYFESGNFEEALRAYDKSIEINPRDETVWNNRGLTLVKLNRFARAIESYDKALEINPKVERIWSNKGLALAKMKQTGKTIDLQKIASAIPHDENAAITIEPRFIGQPVVTPEPEQVARIPSPVETIKEEAVIESRHAEQPVIKAPQPEPKPELVITPPEPETAQEVVAGKTVPVEPVKEMEFIEPRKPVQHRTKTAATVEIPAPKAQQEKPAILHEIPKSSIDHLVTGNTLYSLGKYEDAINSFNKSLALCPENSIAWNNKGMVLAKSGKIDEAIICYDKALDIDPEDCVFLNNKGNALYKKGNIREALKSYQIAFELNPDSSAAIKGMEMCFRSLKKSGNIKKKAQKPKTLF